MYQKDYINDVFGSLWPHLIALPSISRGRVPTPGNTTAAPPLVRSHTPCPAAAGTEHHSLIHNSLTFSCTDVPVQTASQAAHSTSQVYPSPNIHRLSYISSVLNLTLEKPSLTSLFNTAPTVLLPELTLLILIALTNTWRTYTLLSWSFHPSQ